MKIIKIVSTTILLLATLTLTAQVNINIGSPPVWAREAPAATQYYYLPDIETYYDVPSKRYIYLRNGVWTRSVSLPYQYRSYNLYNGRTIFLTDYRGKSPYRNYNQHRIKYKAVKNWKSNKNYNSNSQGNNKEKRGKEKGKEKGKNK